MSSSCPVLRLHRSPRRFLSCPGVGQQQRGLFPRSKRDILGGPNPPASWKAPPHSFRLMGRAWRGARPGSRGTLQPPAGWLGPHVTWPPKAAEPWQENRASVACVARPARAEGAGEEQGAPPLKTGRKSGSPTWGVMRPTDALLSSVTPGVACKGCLVCGGQDADAGKAGHGEGQAARCAAGQGDGTASSEPG